MGRRPSETGGQKESVDTPIINLSLKNQEIGGGGRGRREYSIGWT